MGWKRNTSIGRRRHNDIDGPLGRTEQAEETAPKVILGRVEPDLVDEYIRKHGVTKVPPAERE